MKDFVSKLIDLSSGSVGIRCCRWRCRRWRESSVRCHSVPVPTIRHADYTSRRSWRCNKNGFSIKPIPPRTVSRNHVFVLSAAVNVNYQNQTLTYRRTTLTGLNENETKSEWKRIIHVVWGPLYAQFSAIIRFHTSKATSVHRISKVAPYSCISSAAWIIRLRESLKRSGIELDVTISA